MDAERFATGLTYEQFKVQMTRNRDALEEIEAGVQLDPRDVAHFRSLGPLHVVALVEDWCGDVIANLPVVAKLAQEAGPALDLRCFVKDRHPELAERYLNRGRFESIPVFACFSEDWREVGVLIERPTAVTERREEDRQAIYAAHPELGSPDVSPSTLSDEQRDRLRDLTLESRRRSRAWAERQLLLALRDCTARAPQVGERAPHHAPPAPGASGPRRG